MHAQHLAYFTFYTYLATAQGASHCVDVPIPMADVVVYHPTPSAPGIHLVGSEVEVDSCVEGYALDGPPKNATCEMISSPAGATWMGLSACNPVCPMIYIQNATVHYHSQPAFIGEEATLECASEQYHLEGPYLTTCQENQTWTTLPICLKICPWFESQFDNHQIMASYDGDIPEEGVFATFSCVDNYGLLGSLSALCQESGEWLFDDEFPVCNPTCPAVPVEAGVVFYSADPRFEGVDATVTCDAEHAPSGPAVSVCVGATHQWSPPIATCEQLCPQLTVAHSNITYSGEVPINGVTATFTCAEGYHPDGSPTITCVKGSWASPPPVCKIKCSKPVLAFGVPRLTHDPPFEGSVVLFDCRDGYKLNVASEELGHTATCQADGHWSHSTPICIEHQYCGAAGTVAASWSLVMVIGGVWMLRNGGNY